MIHNKLRLAAAATVAAALVSGEFATAQVEVIVSEVGPTSNVGVAGRAVDSMFNFSISPDGRWWAGEFNLDGDFTTDAIHLRGAGLTVMNVIWQEDTTPLPGGLTGNFDEGFKGRQTDINGEGIVYGTGENTVNVVPDELIYRFDGMNLTLMAADGQTIPAFPTDSFGDVLHSPNALASGEVGFVAEDITGPNITTLNDEISLTANGSQFAGQQKGVTTYGGQTLENFDDDDYHLTPAGTRFLFQGDLAGTTNDDVVVYGEVGTPGSVVLHEGVTPIDGDFFSDADQVFLAPNGDWYARGDTVGLMDVALKNGVVIGKEGDAAPNGFNYVDHTAISGDSAGNYVFTWDTDNPDTTRDELLVYNGSLILLTEGDTILFDQDGDGMLDDLAVVDEFDDSDIRLSPDGWVYMMVDLDDPAGVSIGDAFIRVAVPEPACLSLMASMGLLAMRRRRRT